MLGFCVSEEEEGLKSVTDDGEKRGSHCLLTPINYQSVRPTWCVCMSVCETAMTNQDRRHRLPNCCPLRQSCGQPICHSTHTHMLQVVKSSWRLHSCRCVKESFGDYENQQNLLCSVNNLISTDQTLTTKWQKYGITQGSVWRIFHQKTQKKHLNTAYDFVNIHE